MESNGVEVKSEPPTEGPSEDGSLYEKINTKLEQVEPDEESETEYNDNVNIMDFCDVNIEQEGGENNGENNDNDENEGPINNSCKIEYVENEEDDESNESSNEASFYGFGVEACYEDDSAQAQAHFLNNFGLDGVEVLKVAKKPAPTVERNDPPLPDVPYPIANNGYKLTLPITTDGKYLSCDICSKNLSTLRELTNHRCCNTSEKTFFCTVCQKGFVRQGEVIRHKCGVPGGQVLMAEEKPHECDVCHKRFTRRKHLTRHYRIHSEKVGLCPTVGDDEGLMMKMMPFCG